MKYIVYVSILLTLGACSEGIDPLEKNYIIKPDGSKAYRSEGVELTLLKEGERGNVKNFDGVSFVFKDISSIDYLIRIGETPSYEDQTELADESVFMLELVGHKPSGNLFEDSEIKFSEEEATKYLIGEIENDFVIIQNEKRFKPNGVQYDGVIGTGQKIRVAFFMEGINLHLPYTIEYYDRLFGKGLVKLTRKKTDVIS